DHLTEYVGVVTKILVGVKENVLTLVTGVQVSIGVHTVWVAWIGVAQATGVTRTGAVEGQRRHATVRLELKAVQRRTGRINHDALIAEVGRAGVRQQDVARTVWIRVGHTSGTVDV